VRTYSSLHGGSAAAEYAVRRGLRVSAGAWLGPENTAEQRDANRQEIEAVIALSKRVRLESIIVGNEVLLRHDLPCDRLASYINEVRSRVGVPVTTAETAASYEGEERLVAAVDYALVHIYPY
jgi:glucan 1,3-beta-glucosidase